MWYLIVGIAEGLEIFSFVRFEVFTAVTMKNATYWDIKTHFVPHRRHITSPLHICGYKNPAHTSQETHCVSAAQPSRLMVCNV
jgi:hypothetical protein